MARVPLDPSQTAAPLVPSRPSLRTLREAAAGCKACPIGFLGTQTVFGEGPAHARLFLLGEQPGDQEDLQGHPFVGPAGKLLDRALVEAGVDRSEVYVTNAVKHFKWEPRGKRRIHQKPNDREIEACHPWLDAELHVVRPDVIVCLGATAAQALFGRRFKVTESRGVLLPSPVEWARFAAATVHPSAPLRAPDDERRREAIAAFIRDIVSIAESARSITESTAPNPF